MTPGHARIVATQAILGALHNAHVGGAWDIVHCDSDVRRTVVQLAIGVIDTDRDTGEVIDKRPRVTIVIQE